MSNPEKLGRTDFPIPFSFVYGDDDWVPLTDDGASKRLIEAHQFSATSGQMPPQGCTPSQYHVCPSADHNMHMDNPIAFANIIINDLIPGADEPILGPQQYEALGYSIDAVDYQADFDKDMSFVEKQIGQQESASTSEGQRV